MRKRPSYSIPSGRAGRPLIMVMPIPSLAAGGGLHSKLNPQRAEGRGDWPHQLSLATQMQLIV